MTFTKTGNQWHPEWISEPKAGVKYRIIARWLKGYVLYLNGYSLATDSRLNALKQTAKEHFKAASMTGITHEEVERFNQFNAETLKHGDSLLRGTAKEHFNQ